MMRLQEPDFDHARTIASCVEGITGNNQLKDGVAAQMAALIGEGRRYRQMAQTIGLASIKALKEEGDPVIFAPLRKSDLKKLYENYLRGQEKPGREIYDKILNSAEGKCPYCGGLGSPRNLDHHLPFAYFPQFSILPINLVPACRDCNMDGKPAGFATIQSKRIIQPYLDDVKFFEKQWISGRFVPPQGKEPARIEYFANPPPRWSAIDQSRARSHFVEFGLSAKYATHSAAMLGTTLAQIKQLRSAGLNDANILTFIISPGEQTAPFINHWLTGMFQALRRSIAIL